MTIIRKIVIADCDDCPHRASRYSEGFGAEYLPACGRCGDMLPFDVLYDAAGIMRAKKHPGIPDWCPLQADAESQPESFVLRPDGFKSQAASDTQPVAVSHTVTLLDAREFKPPNNKKILCGSARKFGTTVIGHFDQRAHDCWFPMPGFPASLKGRR